MSRRAARALAASTALGLLLSGCLSGQEDGPTTNTQTWRAKSCAMPHSYALRIQRGYFPGRSPEVSFVPQAPHLFATSYTTSNHSGPWGHLQRVPLLLYGPEYIRARGAITVDREVTLADIAPTLGRLLDHPWSPRGGGTPIDEALVDRPRTPPSLVVVLVLDGGGQNVLDRWPSAWPFLQELIKDGTYVKGATVGSSPTSTAPAHATIGTGTFPSHHGVIDVVTRVGARTQEMGLDLPRYLETPTFADEFDRARGNRPKMALLAEVPWHMGMMGAGSSSPGGDADILVLYDHRGFYSGSDYRLPPYVHTLGADLEHHVARLDQADGLRDGKWKGQEDLSDETTVLRTPAWTTFQTALIEQLVRREGFGKDAVPDIFFTNYKPIDLVGHTYGLEDPFMEDALRSTDRSIRTLVSTLNDLVGRKRWVLAVTADHGVGRTPLVSSGWPINAERVRSDLQRRFPQVGSVRPFGVWTTRGGGGLGSIAQEVIEMVVRDNLPGKEYPAQYQSFVDDPLFAAAFPSTAMKDIITCTAVE